MKKLIPALVLLLTVSFIAFFLLTHHGDERQIRRNLISLAARLSRLGNESELMALANIKKIKLLFTQDCRIMVGAPIPEIRGHDMLLSTLHQTRRVMGKIEVDFYDISVIIEEDLVTARATMTAMATGLDSQRDERIIEVREVKMYWKKVEGEWRIAEVRLIRTLR
ncbi:nuclear transport factor 2 family protein [candidate division NPL-UPA2 bacterium]|nr:nuclear transport factor 2 family protein [candidate division NPL-UPA2 bacterium]